MNGLLRIKNVQVGAPAIQPSTGVISESFCYKNVKTDSQDPIIDPKHSSGYSY